MFSLSWKKSKKIILKILFFVIAIVGVRIVTANAANCEPKDQWWSFGPNMTTAYIDVCYINMNTSDIDDDFDILQISGSGIKSGNNISWIRGGCSTYLRATTKNCSTNPAGGDCVYVQLKTQPKAGQNNGSHSSTAIAHVRYPDGSEGDLAATGGYSYSDCNPPAPVNGVCGSHNGATLSSTPTSLCNAGSASGVSGSGPWSWSCAGSNGGSTANCSANLAPTPVNGVCGAHNGATLSSTPTSLCNAGSASGVSGSGPWSWSCAGSNGGSTANCSANLAPTPVNGVCGSHNGATLSSTPTSLCNAGSASGVSGSGPWSWSCAGSNGGSTANCSANLLTTPVNGLCGASNGATFSSAPSSGLCNAGSASGVSGSGPWSWSCIGSNGGSTVNCSANPPATPAPTCSISASPSSINQGSSSTLSWSSSNASSLSINQGIGNVGTSGNQSVSPVSSTTYTATVTGAGGSNTCSTTITVVPPAANYDLSVSVNVDDTQVAPNLHTNPSNPIYTNLTYSINYQNIGNATMTNIVVTEDYDQSKVQILTSPGAVDNGDVLTWNISTLNVNDTGTFTYEARLLDSVASGETITDAVQIGSTTPGMQIADEVNQANNNASVTVNVNESNRASERKRVTNLNTGITSTAVHAVEGDVLEYVLSYTAGSADVTAFNIVDDDPNFESIFLYADLVDQGLGTFTDSDANGRFERATFGPFDIPAYQTQEVRFRVQIKPSLLGIGGDYTLRNAYGNDVTVVTLPNLSFAKFVSVDGDAETQNDSALPGSVLDYRLSVTNAGGADRNGFVFEDDITDILEYTTITNPNGGTITTNAEGEQIISWDPVTIPAGGTVNQTFTATIDNPLISGGDYTLRNVYGNAVTIVTIPDVLISKSVSNADNSESGQDITADENHILTYTLSASSTGGYSNYVFTDDVSDILEYANVLNISNGGVLAGGVITWPQTNIPANTTVDRTFEAHVYPAASWPNGLGYDRTMTNVFGNTVTVTLPGGVNQPDLHIEKTAIAENATNPPSGAAGTDVSYTIRYRNEGDLDATVTRIIDDYDEVNLVNIRNVVVPAGVTTTDDGDKMTFTIGNLAIGESGIITYDATISAAAPHGQDIVNTADILSAEVDEDPTDNQASALVRVASLQVDLNKSVSLGTVGNNQTVTYTITIANREPTAQTLTITDTFGTTPSINGSSGGNMTFNAGSQNIVFSGGGSAVGNINDTAGITFTDIEANRSATITYTAISSNAGIPTNGTSNVINTAVLSQSGATVYTASRTVIINGPSGGGSSSSGGGGGSSSSSGGGGVYETTDPQIQKLVSVDGGKFIDANLPANALILRKNRNNLVTYKVVVKNPSKMNLENVQIEDLYDAQKSKISQTSIRNVRGATYKNGIFVIDEIEKNSQRSFTYQATLNTNSVNTNSSAFNQVKITDYKRTGSVQGTKRTGQMDRAYLIVPPDAVDRLLYKYSNKSSINDGDELVYTIIVKNIYDYDLRNVLITDNYDEAHIEILSAPGVNNGSTLQFKRTIIRPGQSVIFRYTAKGINKSAAAVQSTNFVRIFTDNVDLSSETAERTVTIYPFNAPRRLAQTGTGEIVLAIIALTGAAVIMRRRKIYN